MLLSRQDEAERESKGSLKRIIRMTKTVNHFQVESVKIYDKSNLILNDFSDYNFHLRNEFSSALDADSQYRAPSREDELRSCEPHFLVICFSSCLL